MSSSSALQVPRPVDTRSPYRYELAGAEADADVRRLLRESRLQGAIEVSLEREPNSRLATGLEGELHERVLARDREDRVVAMGSRSVRECWVGGELQRVGYYGELRVDPRHRARPSLVRGGFREMRRLHEQDGATQHYFASVIADNRPALRLLQAGLPGFPRCRVIGDLLTLVLRVRRRRRRAARGLELRGARPGDLDELLDCLERNGRRHALAPHWTREDLLSDTRTRGLDLRDFVIASRAGRTVGCLALWDQREFKQVVVHAYGAGLGRLRSPINLGLALSGRPTLPAAGSRLNQAFASHLAVDDDDPEVVAALLDAVADRARRRGISQLVTSFAASSSSLPALSRRFPAWRYRSTLLAMSWSAAGPADFPGPVDSLQPEIAIL